MSKPSKKIPRFVLGLSDTKTDLNLHIAADQLGDFVKFIPKDQRKNEGRTEFEAMLLFFADAVAKEDGLKPRLKFDDEGKPKEEL